MEKEDKKKLLWVGIFAIAMAFVETMIVFYLRKLYYPSNILFPLNVSMPTQILVLEWIREASTIIMLFAVAVIAGKKVRERFAYFIYAFAIWDIFYYVWLKVILNWPASLMTWDVLFLIPITWASPVLCPILVSLTMILGAYLILNYPKKRTTKDNKRLIMLGGALIYASFVLNYSELLFKKAYVLKFSEVIINQKLTEITPLITQELIATSASYIPSYFNWPIFILGELLVLLAIYLFYRKIED
jgi:hypothetical protein